MFFPVFGDEKGGFDLVTDEGRGKLFKTIVALSESLEETRKELFKDGGLKTPQEWHEIISGWLNQYFVTNETPQEILSFEAVYKDYQALCRKASRKGQKFLFRYLERYRNSSEKHSKSCSTHWFHYLLVCTGIKRVAF